VDIKHLKCFLQVAELQNFTKAARILSITQSAVSYQVSALEKELGFKLFVRSPHLVRFTTPGRHFYYGIRDMMGFYGNLVRQARELEAGTTGELSLGILGHAGGDFLPRLMRAFREGHPAISLNVSQFDMVGMNAALESGDIDMGLTLAISFGLRPDFETLTLFHEPLSILVAEDHPLAAKPKPTFADLRGYPIVDVAREGAAPAKVFIAKACARLGFAPEVVQWANDFDTLFLLVESGVGMAVLPRYRAETHGNTRIRVMDLCGEDSRVEVVLAWKRKVMNPAVGVMLQALESLAEGG